VALGRERFNVQPLTGVDQGELGGGVDHGRGALCSHSMTPIRQPVGQSGTVCGLSQGLPGEPPRSLSDQRQAPMAH
jgi:hypothetical protein